MFSSHVFNKIKLTNFLIIIPIFLTERQDYIVKAEQIVRKFNCVYEMMPLLYALVKATKGNVEQSERLLIEGKSLVY